MIYLWTIKRGLTALASEHSRYTSSQKATPSEQSHEPQKPDTPAVKPIPNPAPPKDTKVVRSGPPNSVPQPPKPQPAVQNVDSTVIPSIKAILQIDSVESEYIQFHIEMENSSQVHLTEIGLSFKSPEGSDIEVAPQMFRSMDPGDKLSSAPAPFMLKTREYNTATVIITYTGELNPTPKKFTAIYKFFFVLSEAKKQTAIYPDNIERKAGQVPTAELVKNEFTEKLAHEIGSINLVLPEIGADGNPNKVSLSDGRTAFLFDAAANQMLFRRLSVSNKWLEILVPIREPGKAIGGIHGISFTWSSSEIILHVDGIEKGRSGL